ncbi:MAG: hypothetical protein ABI823_11600, partial [Bryobacteraceae bacterium]
MRTGSSLCLLAVLLWFATGAVAGEKQKKPAPYSVVAGTVFREPGFALQGVSVTLSTEPATGSKEKVRKLQATSDSRGEFAFR